MSSRILRRQVKSFLGAALWPFPTGIVTSRLVGEDRGLVLTFHYVGEPVLAGAADDLFVPLEEFRRILDFIAGRLTPLAPAEFLERMVAGSLPRRATLITFDDCLGETVTRAVPELVRRNLRACFFACPGLIDAGRTVPSLDLMSMCADARPGEYLVRAAPGGEAPLHIRIDGHDSRVAAFRRLWPELIACPSRSHAALLGGMRQDFRVGRGIPERLRLAGWETLAGIERSGMLVGNHTMLHSTVTADGIAQFASDVEQAYRSMESRLGTRTRVFCYPYGRAVDRGQGAEEALRAIDTRFAFLTQGGIANPGRTGCLNLHREDASYSVSATKLAPLLAVLR